MSDRQLHYVDRLSGLPCLHPTPSIQCTRRGPMGMRCRWVAVRLSCLAYNARPRPPNCRLARSMIFISYLLRTRRVMSSRYLHPIACRLPRAERNAIAEIARRQDLSVSALAKEALRRMLFGVHPGVNPPGNFCFTEEAPKPGKTTVAAGWNEFETGLFPRRPMANRTPLKPATLNRETASGWRD